MSRTVVLLVAVLFAVGATACGDDSTSSTGTTGGGGGDESTTTGDSGSEGGNGDIGNIPNMSPQSGSAHVEVSGDEDITFDFTEGTGYSAGDFLSAVFTDADAQATLNVVVNGTGQGQESGFSLTVEGVTTGADFSLEDCTFELTDTSSDHLAGEFHCSDLDALDAGSTDSRTVDVDASFELNA